MAKEKPLDEQLDDVREDDGQIYVERDKLDFDPEEGLLSGTAIDGSDESDETDHSDDDDGDSSKDSQDDDS